jgi:energy-coupling factor transporter ATP-binding protein EcfA2
VRVTRLAISEWRSLQNVDLIIDPDAPLVCLVGENGTGKSAILELLSSAAHHLGISPGIESRRGDPFSQVREFVIDVVVPVNEAELQEPFRQSLGDNAWNGALRFQYRREQGGVVVTALGVPEEVSVGIAANAVQLLRSRGETQHLYLDADFLPSDHCATP